MATALDRVLDYANAHKLSVRWGKERPGLWEVRVDHAKRKPIRGYGESLQDAAGDLLERLGEPAELELSRMES